MYVRPTHARGLALATLFLGCAADEAADLRGRARLAIAQAPANLACLRVTVAGGHVVERRVDVAPGQRTVLELDALPLGAVTVSADGYDLACASVGEATLPAWVSDPVPAALTADAAASVTVRMRGNGRAAVAVDFPDAPDRTAPTVTATSPADGAAGVAPEALLSATLSEAVSPDRVTPATFLLQRGALPVPGAVTLLGATAWLVPSQRLGPAQSYRATLTTGVRDLANNALAAPRSWGFVTRDGAWAAAERTLRANATISGFLKVRSLPSGGAVAVWREAAGTDRLGLFAAVMSRDGQWAPPTEIGAGAYRTVTAVELVGDRDGNALVTFVGYEGLRDNLLAARYTPAAGWSGATSLEVRVESIDSQRLFASPSGHALAVWTHRESGGPSATWVNRYVPGAGWRGPEALGVASGGGFAASVDDAGNAQVFYPRHEGAQANLYGQRWDGAAWGPPLLLETEVGNAGNPHAVADASGAVTLVWTQSEAGRVDGYANRYTPGVGWAAPQRAEAVAEPMTALGIGVDAAGNVTALWHQSAGAQRSVWLSRAPRGGSWGAPVQLDAPVTSPAQSLSPFTLHVDDEGNAMALWGVSDPTGASSVRAARCPAREPCAPASTVSAPGARAFLASYSADAEGRGLAAWQVALPSASAFVTRAFQ